MAWIASLLHWLSWAYALEFGGKGVYSGVWMAGLVWVLANAFLIRQLVFALRCVERER